MEITKEQIKELVKIAQAIDDENRIDDDVTGGYIEEPYNSIIGRIYAVVNECDGKRRTRESNCNKPIVSQQRELLKAYDEFAETEHCWYIGTEDETKENFLKAFNCL